MPRRRVTGKLRSMTGFGRGVAKAGGVTASAEIRSVNKRFLRVGVRLPSELAPLEPRVREMVEGAALRGQVDASVSVDGAAALAPMMPDLELARRYVEAWRGIARKLGLRGEVDVATLAAMPALFASNSRADDPESGWPAVERALGKALGGFRKTREVEGACLARELRSHLGVTQKALGRIGARVRRAKVEFAKRLQERVQSLLDQMGGDARSALSPANLEREIAIYADRSDVSEEMERIGSHMEQFRATLSAGSPAGRKLDFLVQEIQREITTLGSKVADAEAGREVVEFKAELEKIREQVQNIE